MKGTSHVTLGGNVSTGAAIVLVAVALTGLLGIVVVAVQTRYFDYYPYFFDHVYYTYFNVRLHEQMLRDGQLRTAVAEWLTNARHPLRTVPPLLFAPSLLTAQFGHLATSLPFLAVFLGLLGLHLHRRTGSLPYALAGMALFTALPGLLSPRFGLGAYWLETVASPLLGSAVLCLLLSDRGRSLGWLGAFAMFAALACLSRYVTVAFATILCAPILVAFLGRRLWEERDVFRALVLPVLVIGTVGGLLAGYFLLTHLRENQVFYTFLGPVGVGKRKAVALIGKMLLAWVGGAVGATLSLSACALAVSAFRNGPVSWTSLALTAWIGVSIPVLLVMQGAGADEAAHVVWFTIPPLFITLAAPLTMRRRETGTGDTATREPSAGDAGVGPASSGVVAVPASGTPGRTPTPTPLHDTIPLLRRLAAIIAAVAVCVFCWTAVNGWRDASAPPPNVAGQKALDVALANALTSQGDGLVWNAYFDEYAWIPTMEAHYRSGRLVVPAGQPFYHLSRAPSRTSHWEFEFPGYTPEALGRRIAESTNRLVDLAVVFDDPGDADTAPWITDLHSRAVSRMVAEEVRANASWEQIATVESTQYGRLAVYVNRASNGVGYERALRGELRP